MKRKTAIITAAIIVLIIAAAAVMHRTGYRPYEFDERENEALMQAWFEDTATRNSIAAARGMDTSLSSVSAVEVRTAEEYLDAFEIVGTGRYIGRGDIIGMGNGIIEIEGVKRDDTAYYIETFYLLDEVISGEKYINRKTVLPNELSGVKNSGTVVMAYEYVGFGEDASEKYLSEKSGDYLLGFSADAKGRVYYYDVYTLNPLGEDGSISWQSAAMKLSGELEGTDDLRIFKRAADYYGK